MTVVVVSTVVCWWARRQWWLCLQWCVGGLGDSGGCVYNSVLVAQRQKTVVVVSTMGWDARKPG